MSAWVAALGQEPWTVALLATSAIVYARGVRAAWRRGAHGRSKPPSPSSSWSLTGGPFGITQVAAFAAGLISLALALLSPLARLAAELFSAHMTQHEILMLVSAPLLVIGQPLLAALWALPSRQRISLMRRLRHASWLGAWRWLTAPLVVFVLHGVALWIWHVPALFEWALRDDTVHAWQHASFVITAALFWWGIAHGRYGRAGYGVAVLYVFLTGLHSALLGALLTVAPSVWYGPYAANTHGDALADQQLAGLVMWVPTGVLFILVGLALMAAWLGESERRVRLGSTGFDAGPGLGESRGSIDAG